MTAEEIFEALVAIGCDVDSVMIALEAAPRERDKPPRLEDVVKMLVFVRRQSRVSRLPEESPKP